MTDAFPTEELPVTVELCLKGDSWTDISGDVRLSDADSGGGLTIARGIRSSTTRTDPATCTAVLDNRQGKYSPRWPLSTNFGKIGRNTPVRVGIELAADDYGRTDTAGWGGQWTASGGTTSTDYPVAAGVAQHLHPSANVLHQSFLPTAYTDVEQLTKVNVSAIATGSAARAGHYARWVDADNHLWLRLGFETGGSVQVQTCRRVGGTLTVLNLNVVGTYTGGQDWWLRSSVCDKRLSVKAWPDGTSEPVGWQLTSVDGAITGPGLVGLASRREAGNTNSNLEVSYSAYQAIDRRGYFEVPSWPPRRDITDSDRWVPIEAAGILRRLGQGTPALDSPLRRHYERLAADSGASPVDYWPLESGDGREAEAFISATGGRPLRAFPADSGNRRKTGVVSGSQAGPPGGRETVDLSGRGMLVAGLQPAPYSTIYTVELGVLFTEPVAGEESGVVFRLHCGDTLINVFAQPTPGYETSIELSGSGGFTSVGTTTRVDDGLWHLLRLEVSDDGGSCAYTLWIDGAQVLTGTASGVGFEQPTEIRISPSGDMDAASHVAVWRGLGWGTQPSLDAFTAYLGETVGARMVRLAAEEGLSLAIQGEATAPMGIQGPEKLLDLLGEGAELDGGLLFEARDELGLVYRARQDLLNQPGTLIQFAQVSEPFEPQPDDFELFNDVTAEGKAEGRARAVVETGPNSIQPPPEGIGRYDTAPRFNVAAASQLRSLAYWQLHQKSADEVRYPRIRVDFSSRWWSDTEQRHRVAATDTGGMLLIDGLPDDAGQTLQMAGGYTETIDAFDWDITFNTTPGSVWTAFVIGDPVRGRLATAGSELGVAAGIGDTELVVQTDTGKRRWVTTTEHPQSFPFAIQMGGELVRVNGIGEPILNQNYDFETTISPWAANLSGTVTRSTAQKRFGGASLLLTPDGVSATAGVISEQVLGIVAGQQYRAGAWVHCAAARTINLHHLWYDSGGGFVSLTSSSIVVLADRWTPLYSIAEAPAGAARLAIRFTMGSTPSAATLLHIDHAMIHRPDAGVSPQTFHVERGLNGIDKAHPAGTRIQIAMRDVSG
ncbi:hypothetical protein [Micromonospora sp. NPDC000442]|uniref:hypothetical protein n=1 Tax=Micromonospora sp. NPDC000442 TaxID=3364217 RepID=UPI0036826A53